MDNNFLEYVNIVENFNINPVSIETGNELTTTKWLLSLQDTCTKILDNVNSWYDTLMNDIDNNGLLYQHILKHLDGEFINDIEHIKLELIKFSEEITTLINNVKLLSNIKPKVELSVNPTQTIYNKGESINSIVLKYNITRGTESIDRVEIYKNNTLISTITQNIVDGLNSYVDGNVINSDVEYKIIIYDKLNVVTSNVKNYYFVNNYFFGVIGEHETINQNSIKSLSNLKILKQNIQKEFNCNKQKIIFAYPSIYGDLLEIKYNSINFLESFDKTVVMVDNVNYNVYISKNLLNDIFKVDFNISFDEEITINTTNNNIDGGTF